MSACTIFNIAVSYAIHDLLSCTDSNSNHDVLVPSLTASLLVFSVFTFITGLLLGTLLIKYIVRSSVKNKSAPTTPTPLYEEVVPQLPSSGQFFVKVVDNEAYGPIIS